jgi:hypothetical protein
MHLETIDPEIADEPFDSQEVHNPNMVIPLVPPTLGPLPPGFAPMPFPIPMFIPPPPAAKLPKLSVSEPLTPNKTLYLKNLNEKIQISYLRQALESLFG